MTNPTPQPDVSKKMSDKRIVCDCGNVSWRCTNCGTQLDPNNGAIFDGFTLPTDSMEEMPEATADLIESIRTYKAEILDGGKYPRPNTSDWHVLNLADALSLAHQRIEELEKDAKRGKRWSLS